MVFGRISRNIYAKLSLGALTAALCWPTGGHAAETYCQSGGTSVHDGAETRTTWRVVKASVRKPHLPGQTKASPWCVSSWRSVGAFYRPIEIVARPKLGEAKIGSRYMLGYRSNVSGRDSVSIRVHWADARTGKLSSAVVHYDITVTDAPL